MDYYLEYIEKKLGAQIAFFLEQPEQKLSDSEQEEAAYTESYLSMEIRRYFTDRYGAFSLEEESIREQNEDVAFGEEGNFSPLYKLCRIFSLNPFEQMCLGLAVLGEINPYFEKFFVFMNNDWNSGFLTFDTAVRLYTLNIGNARAPLTDGVEVRQELYRYFLDTGKLMLYFFRMVKHEGRSRVRWGVRLRNTFAAFLFSGQCSAGVVENITRWEDCSSQEEKSNPLLLYPKLDQLFQSAKVCLLCGLQQEEGVELIRQYGKYRNLTICFLNIYQLLRLPVSGEQESTGTEVCQDIVMQAMYKRACICCYFPDEGNEEDKQSGQSLPEHCFHIGQSESWLAGWLTRLCEENAIPCIFIGETGSMDSVCPDIWEIWPEPGSYTADAELWAQLAAPYSLEEGISLAYFANTYRFSQLEIKRVFQRAEQCRIWEGCKSISRRHLKQSCISRTRKQGNHLVTVLDTGYTFEDVVLPERQTEQLRAACNRVRYRDLVYDNWGFGKKLAYGKGVSMVFSGAPGTGKTMSAGIVANTLGTVLYRVDLASVVSKYIGETEKNLYTVFETAKKGCGVLFFDEADVLFGKRTKMKDSHDRHSNMEVAYLLQKMEEYEGIVILATNYIQNLDEAFRRRINFFIEFPFPDEECRRRLWEKAFPEETLMAEIPDYAFLAKQFELSGSNIKNIALQAAFFAAEEYEQQGIENKGVGMEHIIQALIEETKKEGRRVSCQDLQSYGCYYK